MQATLMHPMIQGAIICTVIALLAVGVAVFVRGKLKKAVALAVAAFFLLPLLVVFIGFYPELVDERFAVYKAFYGEIREGMTRDEVFSVMAAHYPSGGARQRPTIMRDAPGEMGFFMNPEALSTEPNCEGIFLRFSGGRVVSKGYSAD